MFRTMFFAISAAISYGQTRAPAFDVAAVKPSKPSSSDWTGLQIPGGGRFNANGVSLKAIIHFAYGVQDSQISGGPNWAGTDLFEVIAKAEGDATPAQIKLMLQTLLTDRFKLVLRHETKEVPVYHLVVAKNGPRLKESSQKSGSISGRGPGQVEGQKASMAMLVKLLTFQLGQTVEDQTDLKGNYDFKLSWMPDELQQGRPGGPDSAANPVDPSGASIFTAIQEQLGLKLEASKSLVEVLVIDHAERPTEN
jgi:uncharacterized protein (TIGR03435 family)